MGNIMAVKIKTGTIIYKTMWGENLNVKIG